MICSGKEKVISISAPKVMESAAGFYIGETCVVKYFEEDGSSYTIEEPWDRYTPYFKTAEEASNILEMFND